MARRFALPAIMLACALLSRSAAAQHGASVSLTHTVTVTVPPRVKVQVGNAQVAASAVRASGQPSTNGLALSINATQPWTLSIGASGKTQLQWSRDGQSGYSALTTRDEVVASGVLSQIPTSANVFVRPVGSGNGDGDSSPVMLTVVAQ
jgi:hypothetical protein